MQTVDRFEATQSNVQAEAGHVVVVFAGGEGAGRALEVAMPIETARLLYSQLTIALNAHQHLIPG